MVMLPTLSLMTPLKLTVAPVPAVLIPAATVNGALLKRWTNRSLALLEAIAMLGAVVTLTNRAPVAAPVAIVPPPLTVAPDSAPPLSVNVWPGAMLSEPVFIANDLAVANEPVIERVP